MAWSYSDRPGERARNRDAGVRIARGSCAVQGDVTVGGRDQIPQVRAAGLGHQAQGGLAAVRTAVAAIFGRLDAWQRLQRGLLQGQEASNERQPLRAAAVGQEAERADPHKTAPQHVL